MFQVIFAKKHDKVLCNEADNSLLLRNTTNICDHRDFFNRFAAYPCRPQENFFIKTLCSAWRFEEFEGEKVQHYRKLQLNRVKDLSLLLLIVTDRGYGSFSFVPE